MHDTAYEIGRKFLEIYAQTPRFAIVELGSMDVNGSLRKEVSNDLTYLGLDYQHGAGVDIVVSAGQPLPLRSEFADVVISSSQLEHDPEFWITLLELFRITKNGGVIYINAPSNGSYHSYPVDVWRFYPDASKAFVAWGARNGYSLTLLESFTAKRRYDKWNDFVCILFKGDWNKEKEINFLSNVFECYNVWQFGADKMLKVDFLTEDQRIIESLRQEISQLQSTIKCLTEQIDQSKAPENSETVFKSEEPPSE